MEPTPAPSQDPRPTELVVLVDDDAGNRLVFEQVFQSLFRLITCASGAEALAILERQPVAVLLTDQRMPGMSGTDLLRIFRERSPHTVGVVVTAYDDNRPMLETVNQQLAARYLLKPWNATELQMVLAWGIEVYRLAREKGELEMRLLQGERFTTIGSVAAGVIHDLNQPLSVLRANLQGLAQWSDASALAVPGAVDALTRELPDLVSDLLAATQQLAEIAESAQRYVTLAQAAHGQGAGDAALGARYAVSLCKPKVAAHGGTLRSRVAPQLPNVRLTTSGLTQVMVNLTLNAAQALVPGRRHSLVELAVAPGARGGLQIEVVDNGCGMADEVLARAREPFFSRWSGGGAIGLGLFNTERLVKEAGGTLTIASVEGAGTTATVWVPGA